MQNKQLLTQTDPKKVNIVALKLFFNITGAWGLTAEQQMTLLGEPGKTTFYKWKKGEVKSLSKDTLERISYISGIYKALRLLFPTEGQANAWPKKPNKRFNNRTAIDEMLNGKMANLMIVRRYLDGMRG